MIGQSNHLWQERITIVVDNHVLARSHNVFGHLCGHAFLDLL